MFNKDHLRSLERHLDEWLKDQCGAGVSGLEIISMEIPAFSGTDKFPYRMFYTYENNRNELRRGSVFFNGYPTDSGVVEDVAFEP